MAPTENVYLKDYILCSPNYVSPLEGSWWLRAALVAQTVKNPPAVWDPGLGRLPGEGNGYPLQYSCLENPMDRGAWRSQGVRHDWVTNSFSRGVQQLGGPVAGPHWQDAFSSGQHCYAQRLASVSVSKTKIFTTHSPPPFFYTYLSSVAFVRRMDQNQIWPELHCLSYSFQANSVGAILNSNSSCLA